MIHKNISPSSVTAWHRRVFFMLPSASSHCLSLDLNFTTVFPQTAAKLHFSFRNAFHY
jgi:hypothetical protein